MLESRHLLFTYLHLAADVELTHALAKTGATCIAYETVEDKNGRLPLLAPMSEVAGKIATQAGAFMLEKPLGGRGILLGGVPGVAAAERVGDRRRRRRVPRSPDRDRHGRDRPPCLTALLTGCASSTSPSAVARTRCTRRLSRSRRCCRWQIWSSARCSSVGAKAPHVVTRKQLGIMKPQAVLRRRVDRSGRLL